MRRQKQQQALRDMPELAESLHDRFSRLGRQLRSIELPRGMTQERMSVLAIVQARGPVSVSALAEHERVRPATMSRMISALEADGYVKRTSDENDGRGVLVAATRLGREAFAAARRQRLAQFSVALNSLSPDELESMDRVANTLENLTQLLGNSK
ncbi:MAG: MarR family transcriptional regulator [Gammaproteobacteria bacterium]